MGPRPSHRLPIPLRRPWQEKDSGRSGVGQHGGERRHGGGLASHVGWQGGGLAGGGADGLADEVAVVVAHES